jgi:hypothetical protein
MAIAVQIDTTLYRSKISGSHGFQRFDHSFNRTVVIKYSKCNVPKLGQTYDIIMAIVRAQSPAPSSIAPYAV